MEVLVKKLREMFPTLLRYKETEKIVEAVEGVAQNKAISILEVGCGYGVNLRALKKAGFVDLLGVDINRHIVASVRSSGFNCVHANDFDKAKQYDLILMSHIIEHFMPDGLLPFVDCYLDALKPGGHLVIVTPLMWHGFYYDFDHVKAYSPRGLLYVFGVNNEQVQYYSRNKLIMEGLPYIGKTPYQIAWYKSFLLRPKNFFERAVQFVLNVLFFVSKGYIGQANWWMGVFRKTS
jgi:SAM-dependent methyltransferase